MGRSHRVPAQEAVVQGPGLLPGVPGVPQGAGAGAQGTQVMAEDIPPAPAVFLEVTRPPAIQGQDV